eukprot:GGOE01065309.1.p1 GENE.GGOE01065309.1~~GGOE01065309.1.p1  ORF type:complete len:313 (+),score=73.12 GGOE01065309.1:36-941(+)
MAHTGPKVQVLGERQPTPELQPDPDVTCHCVPNPLSGILGALFFPCCAIFSITQIDQNEQAAVLYWGKYEGSLKEPGLYCLNSCGRDLRKINTMQKTMNLRNAKVLDAKGNPVVVNGVVTFLPTSAKKARVDVEKPWPNASWEPEQAVMRNQNHDTFLELQAMAVLKQVASRFPYEGPPGVPSLQTEGVEIAVQLRQLLQERVNVTGARILSFDLVDLSYAQEIAQVMLLRQQAEALIDARRLIVQAAVDMTQTAVSALKASQTSLDDRACQQITSNLLTVICSHVATTPTVPLNSGAPTG